MTKPDVLASKVHQVVEMIIIVTKGGAKTSHRQAKTVSRAAKDGGVIPPNLPSAEEGVVIVVVRVLLQKLFIIDHERRTRFCKLLRQINHFRAATITAIIRRRPADFLIMKLSGTCRWRNGAIRIMFLITNGWKSKVKRE